MNTWSNTEVANFGIGCFVFTTDRTSEANEWFKKIEDELGQIGSIKELSTESTTDFFMWSIRRADDTPTGFREIQQPSNGSISFTISIPERIQQKVSPSAIATGRARQLGTEFHVSTRYLYHGPLTFVECLNAPAETDASGAVSLVREYLKSELKKLGGKVSLSVVGPSPFHADFRLKTAAGAKPEDVDPISIQKRRGYDLCTFTFYEDSGLQYDEIKAASQALLFDEFSLYYALVCDREIRQRQLEHISGDLVELTELHQTPGIKGAFKRVFRSSHMARELILRVLMTEAAESSAKRSGTDYLKELKERPGRLLYFDRLQDEMNTSFVTELRAMKESASMLESGRTKSFEVAVLSLATVLGAAGGAVASLLSK